jgi:transposase-like protein
MRRPKRPPRPLPATLVERIDGHLATFAGHLREGLLAASTAVGLEVMAELMAAETDALAGAKGKHQPDRLAYRHGSEAGTVTLGGRRLPVRRPRVRSADGAAELPLASYDAFRSTDLLAAGVVARMLAGLSTRRYGAGLEPVGAGIEARAVGTSRSAVSRRFLAATAERLSELLSRPLGGQRFLVIYLDGFGMGEHLLVGALGVTTDGTKVPLGVVEGTTKERDGRHGPHHRPARAWPRCIREPALRHRWRHGPPRRHPAGLRHEHPGAAMPSAQGAECD